MSYFQQSTTIALKACYLNLSIAVKPENDPKEFRQHLRLAFATLAHVVYIGTMADLSRQDVLGSMPRFKARVTLMEIVNAVCADYCDAEKNTIQVPSLILTTINDHILSLASNNQNNEVAREIYMSAFRSLALAVFLTEVEVARNKCACAKAPI